MEHGEVEWNMEGGMGHGEMAWDMGVTTKPMCHATCLAVHLSI